MNEDDFNEDDFKGLSDEKINALAGKAAAQLLKSQVFTQGCALYALFETHPDPQRLKANFVGHIKQLVDALKEQQTGEFLWRSIEKDADKFLDFLP